MKTESFKMRYTASAVKILHGLNSSIALSTYQAGKVIFISSKNEDTLIQLPRNFERAMGIGIAQDKMAVACKDEVIIFRNSPGLAKFYPKKPNVYDAMYMPRATYHTGALDVHDIAYCKQGLCAVNTNFSSIVQINDSFSFEPIWKPFFINKIEAGDQCHLNGMAIENNEIKYVSALSESVTPRGWTANVATSGIILDYKENKIVASNLPMPHSPRRYKGSFYCLLSANGSLVRINVENGSYETIVQVNAFLRGLDFYQDFAFIGVSKLRKESSSFGSLAVSDSKQNAGVIIVQLSTNKIVGKIEYENSVEEIYDVKVLPNLKRPSILNTEKEDYKLGLSIPNRTFWGRSAE